MKLKYYLRGLGIGIFVTTLILIISYNICGRMSDDEIIRRAKALGMVMSTEEEDELFNKPTDGDVTKENHTEDSTPATIPEETTSEENATETITEPESETVTAEPEPTIPVKKLTFNIEQGTSSQAVSQILVDGGIIEDAKDFNNYMVRSGYTEIIQRGTYTLNSSMSYEEIAKALIRMEENT